MTSKMQRRLQELELDAQQRAKHMTDAIFAAALAALDKEDFENLKPFIERLSQGSTLDDAIANCAPEEASALERLNEAIKSAPRTINGRPLSKTEANHVIFRPSHFRD